VNSWQQWMGTFDATAALRAVLVVAAAVVAGWVLHWLAFWLLERIATRTKMGWDDLVYQHLRGPARLAAVTLALLFFRPVLDEAGPVSRLFQHSLDILAIVCLAWLSVRFTVLVGEFLLRQYDSTGTDNLRSRKVQTQVRILQNVVVVMVVVLGAALVLMTFPGVRRIGASLLASAGIAGIILGLAAQKTIANLIAGIQLAITQPVRIDDVVIVEGEWGWIEEITLTYVVVKIWDLRRLVLPISYFIERPIQNWTRSASEILGTVSIHCDHTADVAVLREQTSRIAATTNLWDGKVCVVQVVECRAEAMEVRILASATDSGKCWELRCFLREQVMDFLRRQRPEWLPRRRVEIDKT
jgi:small-conductance mechanosensitive channel